MHTLTTEQLRKLCNAIGDGSDWPKITDDAQVNFAVDCITALDSEPEWDATLYNAELKAFGF